MSCPALATAGPCLLARLVNDSSGSRGKPLVGDASRCRTRSSFDPPSQRGVRRGVQRTRGKTVLHASQDAWSGRSSEHDEDAARARDAAAASGRVAPLDVKTLVGAELELIMKADPLAFDKALADQLRALASEAASSSSPRVPPTPPLDSTSFPSAGSDSDSNSEFDFDFFAFDLRAAGGLHRPPYPCHPNPQYWKMEGLDGGDDDSWGLGLPADRTLADDLAHASAIVKRAAVSAETRDALYLSIAHKFNACGVPLVVDPSEYTKGTRVCGAQPGSGRHARHTGSSGKIEVTRGLERAVSEAPGSGDASAGRARRRFAEKTNRLLKEMLPDGSETLVFDHLTQIVRDARSAAHSIEGLRREGTPHALAAAQSLAQSASLARIYKRSAQYGYFLKACSARVALEKCAVLENFTHREDAGGFGDEEGFDGFDDGFGGSFDSDGTVGDGPELRPDSRTGLNRRSDAASMWLRASRGESGMSGKAEMADAALSNRNALVGRPGNLPAFPRSVGDWVEPQTQTTAWLRLDGTEESWRSVRARRRRRVAAMEAGAGGGNGNNHHASIGDWIADTADELDAFRFGTDDSVRFVDAPTANARGDHDGEGAGRKSSRRPRQQRAFDDADTKNPVTPLERASSSVSSRAGQQTNPQNSKLPPSLSALIRSMDSSLRLDLFQIAGKETNVILDDHVDALFGVSRNTRHRGESGAASRSQKSQQLLITHAAAVHATPIDALRYLVTEAAAFGSAMHAAEKLGERYDLVRPVASQRLG